MRRAPSAVTIASLFEGAVIPLFSPFGGARGRPWASSPRLVPVAVATLGNFLGACTTYGMARAAVGRVARRESPRLVRAAALISRYGPPALVLSWVPLIGDALVALAGAARMPVLRFAIWTLVGKAARYAALGWAANP